ncbi:MAG: NUDIX hydrolase [Candidatus Scalindua sp. AMX11]|nr:MAG: NUDIX hydrolase [Candidatus Scalindua sp.]NOG83309.1 NUDIX hydrolase [Planctomycetota bacterium]RZV76791.1 MAG: NUDIX hydrolase [Candidatus Scalindua sp. SCAELEC01]TDE63455.1 MAG: NUDIX hydrolase [Candidatus Scalindua sp. AMX11]GJQ57475.1 MAG: GDP-mannose pyrophosphatase NudK [Candidatus Scalindua sp.]
MKVIIKNSERVYDNIFTVDKVILQHEKFDGSMSKDIVRLNFNRGNTVAILLYNPKTQSIVLVKQFRYPAYVGNGPGWLIECVAGIIDNGEIAVAKKEVLEETGFKVDKLIYLTQIYPSPGGCSEKISLYLAYVDANDKVKEGNHMGVGNEDICVVTLPFSKALEMVKSGEICDAKTIISLFFLRDKLKI